MQSQPRWFLARIAVIGLSVLSSKSITRMPGDFSRPSISFGLMLAALCALGVCFVWLLQKFNPMSGMSWTQPSWFANPFLPRQPLQQFHLASWCLIATGTGSLFLGLSSTPRNWAWEIPFSAGVGALAGIRLVATSTRDDTDA